MAKYASKDCAVLLFDGFDVRGVSTSLSDSRSAVLREVTALGDTWPSSGDTGVRSGEFSTDGFYDDATGSSNQMLADSQGGSRIVCYGVEGNTIGRKFTGLSGALEGKYVRSAQLADFHRGRGEWRVSGQVDEGVILQSLATKTADWNTEGADSVDNGASSANGGVGYFQYSALALGTATGLAVKIRHSADDSTYADLITFTTVTNTRGAQRSTVAGTVNRHLAVSGDFTGTPNGSTTAGVFVGFKRG